MRSSNLFLILCWTALGKAGNRSKRSSVLCAQDIGSYPRDVPLCVILHQMKEGIPVAQPVRKFGSPWPTVGITGTFGLQVLQSLVLVSQLQTLAPHLQLLSYSFAPVLSLPKQQGSYAFLWCPWELPLRIHSPNPVSWWCRATNSLQVRKLCCTAVSGWLAHRDLILSRTLYANSHRNLGRQKGPGGEALTLLKRQNSLWPQQGQSFPL